MLIINDLIDLSDNEEAEQGTKIAFSVLVVVVVFCLLSVSKGTSEDVAEHIHIEKKAAKRVFKKHLNTFSTKIVSHVRASPADFVRILTSPMHYKNFKFNILPKVKDQTPSTSDILRQQEQDKLFKDLSKIEENHSQLAVN